MTDDAMTDDVIKEDGSVDAPAPAAPAPAAPAPAAPSLQAAARALKQYFGFDSFRPSQESLVEQVLAGRDVLGVMPTGAGKSIVFQVPAILGSGLAIVVSPLISLMKDQVDSLRLAGIEAAFLNSSLTAPEREAVFSRVAENSCRLLYVAPERLDDPRFLELCQRTGITLVAIDEAHCVSQWGNDFRPSYKNIAAFIKELKGRPPVCALTATATHEVRADIVQSLGLRDPFICVSGFDRANLYLGVERPDPAQKKSCLLGLLKKRPGQNGIVYCSTRAGAEEVCVLLQEHGLAATLYHAGLPAPVRQRNQDDFLYDRQTVMVATNAFGMGIDKSNIGFVIHYNMPRDLESYYQEAGRAGRDGSPADCILIYNKKDVQTVSFFAEKGHTDRLLAGMEHGLSEALYARDLERVRKMASYCTTTDCLRSFILRYFGESESPYRCEHCSSCEAESEVLDAKLEAQKLISCVLRLQQRERALGRAMIVDILRGSASEKLLAAGWDTLSTYGIMRDVPRAMVYAVLDALIDGGYLRVSDSKYPVVTCTPQGRELMRAKGEFTVKVAVAKRVAAPAPGAPGAGAGAGSDAEAGAAAGASALGAGSGSDAGAGAAADAGQGPSPAKRRGRPAAAKSAISAEAVDPALLAKLKSLRAEFARQQGVPAYIVFHDATLIEMCARLPQTVEEFLTISGIGQKKAELYAQAFLACLSQDA